MRHQPQSKLADVTLYAEWESTSSGLTNTGGEMAPVLPIGLGMIFVGAVLATLRKRVRKL